MVSGLFENTIPCFPVPEFPLKMSQAYFCLPGIKLDLVLSKYVFSSNLEI